MPYASSHVCPKVYFGALRYGRFFMFTGESISPVLFNMKYAVNVGRKKNTMMQLIKRTETHCCKFIAKSNESSTNHTEYRKMRRDVIDN